MRIIAALTLTALLAACAGDYQESRYDDTGRKNWKERAFDRHSNGSR